MGTGLGSMDSQHQEGVSAADTNIDISIKSVGNAPSGAETDNSVAKSKNRLDLRGGSDEDREITINLR